MVPFLLLAAPYAIGSAIALWGGSTLYQDVFGIKKLPVAPEVPPAAPQEITQLTNPAAWNPSIMYAQTQANRELAQRMFASGYQAGGGTAQPAGKDWMEQVGDFFASDEVVFAALAVGGVILVNNASGKKGRRRR